MKIHVKKTLSGFAPIDEEGREYYRKCKINEIYYFDIKRVKKQRNYKFLQKYWCMLQVAVDNQERYRDKEDLHEDIKWMLYITENRQSMSGEFYKVVGSVAFDKMDEEEFSRFYSDAVDLILKYVLVGTDADELNNHVMEILNFT